MQRILDIEKKNGFICDMDGVIYHGNRILPGVAEFVEWLKNNDKNFLFLTSFSSRARRIGKGNPNTSELRLIRIVFRSNLQK